MKTANHARLSTAIATTLLGAGLFASSAANAASLTDTKFTYSGYVKLDAIASNYSDGGLPSGNLNRDFYIPSLIPVSGNDEGTQLDLHIRQSRLRLMTETPDGNGDTITGAFEIDFLVTPGGNDRISNSYVPRIRHAYIKYKNWTIGQTWSTFQDVGILPETLDFVGVADGTIFDRQPMVRYTTGAWEFALENPETTVTPNGGGGRILADDNYIPDAVVRYTHKDDWGYFKVAGMVRQLAYDDGVAVDATEVSYGINLSSKIKFSSGDDLRVSFTTGVGFGRYFGLNVANAAVITPDNKLETIDSYGYSIAYRHLWSDKMRSSFSFSKSSIDNDVTLTGTAVTDSTMSARANLLYSPNKRLTFGGEYAFAERETEGGLEGDMNRIQFSAKYAF